MNMSVDVVGVFNWSFNVCVLCVCVWQCAFLRGDAASKSHVCGNAPTLVEAEVPVTTVAVGVRRTLDNEIVWRVDMPPARIVVLWRAGQACICARRLCWPRWRAWRSRRSSTRRPFGVACVFGAVIAGPALVCCIPLPDAASDIETARCGTLILCGCFDLAESIALSSRQIPVEIAKSYARGVGVCMSAVSVPIDSWLTAE